MTTYSSTYNEVKKTSETRNSALQLILQRVLVHRFRLQFSVSLEVGGVVSVTFKYKGILLSFSMDGNEPRAFFKLAIVRENGLPIGSTISQAVNAYPKAQGAECVANTVGSLVEKIVKILKKAAREKPPNPVHQIYGG